VAKTGRVICIVGCGPGAPEYVTPAALRAVEEAEVLIGAERLLELFATSSAEKIALGSSVSKTLDRLETLAGDRNVAVLVSGDPGLYSLSKLVTARFGRAGCRIIPGISSVQVAFARLGLDWANALLISAHKEDPHPDPQLKQANKVAIFCGRETSLRWIADNVVEGGAGDRRIFVMENLTLEDEQVREVGLRDLRELKVAPRTLVLLIKRDLLE
jgi:cobalt-precorrin-7 (C5)-methyltransferase